jgi:single-stranded-DNA-specific exonuclease
MRLGVTITQDIYKMNNRPTNRWIIGAKITPEADRALSEFPPAIRQVLFNRGYTSPEAARTFFEAGVSFNNDPYQMRGMIEAINRIEYAIQNQEMIAVYGDYDVDGVTATALLVQALSVLKARVQEYIPNRFEEGYGLNNDALAALQEQGVRLVITVDCGIRSMLEAQYARSIGLDLIITDHHQPLNGVPEALSVICPKQADDSYPDKDLAGVGLAYKLTQALFQRFQPAEVKAESFLDLVALGTVADLAPLTGENRNLVRQGLERIRYPRRQGLFSLINVAGLEAGKITATNIGYGLGPRLNAAGRLDSALNAYQLLVTSDHIKAGMMAQELDMQNQERQRITREIIEQSQQMALEKPSDSFLIFVVDPRFNPGVVGLAASRLSELYYRPAIVGSQGEQTTRCSCRSIREFDITRALDQCANLLVRHGGHASAAGLTVANENLPLLIERLQKIAEQELAGRDLRPLLSADAEVRLSELNAQLFNLLQYFQPTGYGNPDPVFIARNLRVVRSRVIGKDANHLRLTVESGGVVFDAIAFRQAHWQEIWKDNAISPIDILFTFEKNEYNGNTTFQLNVRDIRQTNGM